MAELLVIGYPDVETANKALDVMKWGQMLANRKEAQTQFMTYYPSGAPRNAGTGSAAAIAVPTPGADVNEDASWSCPTRRES